MEGLVRREDLERLRTLLTQHKVAVVTGEIGSGTSFLLRSLENRWGGRTVRIPYHRKEAAIRRSGLEIVLAGLRSLGVEAFAGELAGESLTDFELASTVLTALHSAQIPDDTLIIIPGVDDMDDASQAAMGHVLRRMSDHRVRIVVSARQITGESPFDGIPRLELLSRGHAEMIELADRTTAGGICPASGRIAVRAASGRPHALGLILQAMTDSQRAGSFAITIPVRIGPEGASMAHEIVGELDDDLEHVLRMLSLAPLTSYSALEREIPELTVLVAELESRGVVERRGSYLLVTDHLVRAAVHWSMTGSLRNVFHERLAAACARHHAQLENWHRSFVSVDSGTAGKLAADALEFIENGLVDVGIEFIERAIALGSEIRRLDAEFTDIAEVLIGRHEFIFSSRYLQFARGSNDCSVSVRARTLSIQLGYLQTQTLPTRVISSWTRDERSAAPREVAELQLKLGQLHCDRGEVLDACELLKEAESLEDHFTPRERQLRDGLKMSVDAARGDDRLALARFAELSGHEEDDLRAEYLLAMAWALMMTEHYDCAQACLGLLPRLHADSSTWVTEAACMEAEIAIRAGQIGHALGLIDSLAGAPNAADMIRRDRLLYLQCWHLLMSGRASDAERSEAELAGYAIKTRNGGLLAALGALQGHYLLRVGLPAEAVLQLQRCDERSASELNPNKYRHEPDLIEALIRLGRREHAALLLKRLRSRTTRTPSRWAEDAVRRCEALLAPGQQSLDLFQAALRAHPESLHDQALIHTALAERLVSLGSASRSRTHVKIAESLFEEIGAGPPAVRELAALPHAPDPPEVTRPELTGLREEERVVAELVQAGLKNREIANRIFVSLRTVELRLTAIYRKLGVSSRTELMARLAGTPRLATV
ncbi:LuxR C-terminal-related transcriptional regulator [Nesterenkonia natronophila]|uniref:HTH luxR-type domain-containing protein n=1 Tax=Nesterenkonia natronophila TaxID=2174932 RepID=A0A3A4F9V2_9MICC|nr:LuxR C-terminal-related transcriptional regulator [Nesterenkonia natronophila]RJN31594.1 hypothetical protein D3250_05435 [Nesterenkonia natronophila]